MRRYFFATAVFASLLVAPTVSAAVVAVVRPAQPSPIAVEIVSRLSGEFLSVGLDVRLVSAEDNGQWAGLDSLARIERVAADLGADAIVDMIGDKTLEAVDVWTIKKSPRKFEVIRVALEPDTENPPERLALRAIEALRGSLLHYVWSQRSQREEPYSPAPTVASSSAARPAEDSRRLGLELGAAGMGSPQCDCAVVVPLLRLTWSPIPRLAFHALVAGPGSHAQLTDPSGRASLTWQYGLVGASIRFRRESRAWPFVSLSAGALRTRVEGQPTPGMDAHALTRWSLLLDAGVGVGTSLPRHCFMTLAAHAQVAEPFVSIHLGPAATTSVGRPTLGVALTIGAWL